VGNSSSARKTRLKRGLLIAILHRRLNLTGCRRKPSQPMCDISVTFFQKVVPFSTARPSDSISLLKKSEYMYWIV
jgi:hypothetical protein